MWFKKYNPRQYIDLVENSQDSRLQNYMQKEREFISRSFDVNRTYIDLGAGYGRILDLLSGSQVIAIEIDSKMTEELKDRAEDLGDVLIIEGDILNLHALLTSLDINKPVFLLAQNTLGTIEGDWKAVLKITVEEAKKWNGEIILSFFRQAALRKWGFNMYKEIEDMVGEIDLEKTNVKKGLFVSKTGYISKWWTNKEIEEFKKLGKVEDEIIEPEFHILRLSF